MFCTNCGKEIPDKSAFCPECGNSVVSQKDNSASQTPTNSPEEMEQAYYYLLLIEQAKQTANTEMIKGIGWAILGLVITFITYGMASDGGTYFVFWGLVVYGAYIFLRGLFWRISPKSLVKKALEAKSEDVDSSQEK